jgi:hypothetical protein
LRRTDDAAKDDNSPPHDGANQTGEPASTDDALGILGSGCLAAVVSVALRTLSGTHAADGGESIAQSTSPQPHGKAGIDPSATVLGKPEETRRRTAIAQLALLQRGEDITGDRN